MTERPDAAPPKGYPRDATGYPTRSPSTDTDVYSRRQSPPSDAALSETGDKEITEDIFGNRWVTGVVFKPPSDAAPVVITDEDLRSVWNAQFVGLGQPQIDSIKAAIAAVVARHLALAHPEDAPEGPWEIHRSAFLRGMLE